MRSTGTGRVVGYAALSLVLVGASASAVVLSMRGSDPAVVTGVATCLTGSTPACPTLTQLEDAIYRSATLTTMPDLATTDPPISVPNTLDERPYPNRPQCVTQGVTALPVDVANKCAYGDLAAKRTIVVFGDSHAAMFMPAMDIVGKLLGWRVVEIVGIGCEPWYNPNTVDYNGASLAACTSWRDNAVKWIDWVHPAVVIPIGVDGYYGKGKYPTAQQLAAEMTTLFAKLQPSGAKIVLLHSTPDFGSENPEQCLASASSPASCAKPYRDVTGATYNRAVLFAATPGVVVADTNPLFCTATICPVLVASSLGDHLVYFDNQHVLLWYSAWIGRALAQILQPVL